MDLDHLDAQTFTNHDTTIYFDSILYFILLYCIIVYVSSNRYCSLFQSEPISRFGGFSTLQFSEIGGRSTFGAEIAALRRIEASVRLLVTWEIPNAHGDKKSPAAISCQRGKLSIYSFSYAAQEAKTMVRVGHHVHDLGHYKWGSTKMGTQWLETQVNSTHLKWINDFTWLLFHWILAFTSPTLQEKTILDGSWHRYRKGTDKNQAWWPRGEFRLDRGHFASFSCPKKSQHKTVLVRQVFQHKDIDHDATRSNSEREFVFPSESWLDIPGSASNLHSPDRWVFVWWHAMVLSEFLQQHLGTLWK